MKTYPHALMALLAIALLLGCQNSGKTPPAELPPLKQTVLHITDTELETTFSRGQASMTLMTLKGGPRPPDFTVEPGADSPYEFDYLLLGRSDVPLIVSFGGSQAMQRGWNKYLEINPKHIDIQEHHSDLFLARAAVEALASDPKIGSQFKWELDAIRTSVEATIKDENLTDPQR